MLIRTYDFIKYANSGEKYSIIGNYHFLCETSLRAKIAQLSISFIHTTTDYTIITFLMVGLSLSPLITHT